MIKQTAGRDQLGDLAPKLHTTMMINYLVKIGMTLQLI